MARIAYSLDTMRTQFNKTFPNRSKVSDGWIGDAAHQATKSDHNPDQYGIVRALDITHDSDDGVDTWKIADTILQVQDPRLSYVISNGRIGAGPKGNQPGKWRKYNGKNPHNQHMHVSVVGGDIADDAKPWKISGVVTSPAPKTKPAKGITAEMQRRMLLKILQYEGRFDGGQLKVFIAPDGRPEIGGITQLDHPKAYERIKRILDTQGTKVATEAVIQYYDEFTGPAQVWSTNAGPQFICRDLILNRGRVGGAKIVQEALKLAGKNIGSTGENGDGVDGEIGPKCREHIASMDPKQFILLVRKAREAYEWKVYTRALREQRGQVQGLINRWNKSTADALAFQAESDKITPEATTGVGGGGVGMYVTSWFTDNMWAIVGVGIVVAVLAAWLVMKARNK